MRHWSRSTPLILALVLLVATPGRAQQEWSFEGDQLLVTNLIGEVTVRGHDGSRISVRANPGGDDAELLDFQLKREGEAEFHVIYPLERSRSYSYPRLRGGRTRLRLEGWRDESSFLEEIFSELSGRDHIEIRGRGGDLEVWTDLEILVPRGVATRVKLAVGQIEAADVDADLDLDTHSGSVRAENIRGDTRIDTGSGSVIAARIRGALTADTGSGKVEVEDVEGDAVRIDTGSGSVRVDGARTRVLEVDTGSGSVRTSDIDATSTTIDTGSGSVTLDLVRLGEGSHLIDTGSGGVTVVLPRDASVRIHAEAGSGGIDLDVPEARIRKVSRDEIELEIGESEARLEIDTGSGSIKIRTR